MRYVASGLAALEFIPRALNVNGGLVPPRLCPSLAKRLDHVAALTVRRDPAFGFRALVGRAFRGQVGRDACQIFVRYHFRVRGTREGVPLPISVVTPLYDCGGRVAALAR
jgi:hypothetical protein